MDWRAQYASKITSAEEAVKCVKSGDMIVFGQAHGTPHILLEALAKRADELKDVKLFNHILWGDPSFLKPENAESFRYMSIFLAGASRKPCAEGRVDYVPMFYYDCVRYYETCGTPDVFFVMLTEPNEKGECSFSLNTDYAACGCRIAKTVVAQINPELPWTNGPTISLDDLDYIVDQETPIPEIPMGTPGEIERQIAAHIAPYIQDGACLQLGIGGIPDAILPYLKDKKDLGIHSELFSDGIVDLYNAGAITGAKKNIDKGKMVANFLMGTKKLFDFVDHNPDVLILPVDYVNDPRVIAQNDNVVSINSCVQVDLLGQVNADTINGKLFSGVGGQVDFVRGASMSKNGISIIALPSTAAKGTVSRIVPHLGEHSPVTTSRFDVHIICTEYGAVNLRGKTIRERAKLLISIAHPDFRKELEDQAIREGLI